MSGGSRDASAARALLDRLGWGVLRADVMGVSIAVTTIGERRPEGSVIETARELRVITIGMLHDLGQLMARGAAA